MDPLDLIAAAKARRASSGFVAQNGVHCRNAAEVAYYDLRDTAPRDGQGRIIRTAELQTAKKMIKEG